MADEFQLGSGNWWDSTRNRFDSGSSPPSSSSAALSGVGSFGWPTEIVDLKARSSMDSVSVSGSSMVDSGAGSGSVLADPDLQIMGLRLSSPAMDWNQTSLHGGKAESSFRSVLQETVMGSSSQDQWRQKIYSGNSEDSSGNEYKQIARGFSLDQPQFSSHISSGDSAVTCQGLATSTFQRDQAAYGSPSTIIQGLLGPDHSHQQQSSFDSRPINYPFPPSYSMNSGELSPSWSKFPQFLRTSPPKQQLPNQLQFSNNTPFWNATAASMNDARSSFFPSLQPQFPPPTFDEKPKVRDLVEKKSISETSNKRSRNETSSPLPAFKVRKEKMGDRVTALQQLVSPFGKTDTASVLSEAIDYIKFLHEQVNVLSSPYMKIGASMQHHQNSDKSKDPERPKQDLISRGLCLVPVSSTFPVTHETTVDFWTPTFGGTFR